MSTKSTKAIDLLKSNKSVSERAESYYTSIKRDIQRDVVDELTKRKEKIEDDLFELKDFSLETDVNKGNVRMTKEDCKSRFMRIIDLEFELTLIEQELKIKSESFNKYFG